MEKPKIVVMHVIICLFARDLPVPSFTKQFPDPAPLLVLPIPIIFCTWSILASVGLAQALPNNVRMFYMKDTYVHMVCTLLLFTCIAMFMLLSDESLLT